MSYTDEIIFEIVQAIATTWHQYVLHARLTATTIETIALTDLQRQDRRKSDLGKK
jgi:hypothetical protein